MNDLTQSLGLDAIEQSQEDRLGRGHRMLMLERLIERFEEAGARFSTLASAAEEFRGIRT